MAHARRRLGPLAYVGSASAVVAAGVVVSYRAGAMAPLIGLAVAGAVTIAVLRPMVALHAAVALIPLELLSVSIGRIETLSPTDALVTLAGFSWALRRVAGGHLPLVRSRLNKPLALVLLATAGGVLVTSPPLDALKTMVVWTALALVVQMLICEGSTATARSLLGVLALSGAAAGALALGGGAEPLAADRFGRMASGRAVGSFPHPNTLAAFLVFPLVSALALAVAGPARLRPAQLAAFTVVVVALSLSLSRAGFLAAASALCAMLAARAIRRGAIAALLALVVAALAGINPVVHSRAAEVVVDRLGSIRYEQLGRGAGRTLAWRGALKIIGEHPVLGVGVHGYREAAARYGVYDRLTGGYLPHAHSLLLNLGAERGILAAVGFLWLLVAAAQQAVSGIRRAASGQDRTIALALAAGLLGFFVHGLVDYPLHSNVIAAVVFVFIGLSAVLARQPSRAAAA